MLYRHSAKLTMSDKFESRLRYKLRDQRGQQVTALVNLTIGFDPVGGVSVMNVIECRSSILRNEQVCGLVKRVLGIVKQNCPVGLRKVERECEGNRTGRNGENMSIHPRGTFNNERTLSL